ncbi:MULTISPECIES: exosome complex RNA-binding protein Csl4 [Acidiplasma]|uniref:Exosome complex component Csl4 n=2 Tax=Acidiplasma TaxID=507753 RepID=A0A0Q0XKN2_9ARCH|nr:MULTISPECIES: exosome complex RNA-binding protein Csl4 [Acidiplasma]KJE49427.1 hypothetical protein TZ01_05195 [Acidiplasma sp. MBA-1]KPV47480.1 hypothetical protein SE19_00880 [Acidiplasma aeolicum]KQB34516.1 hypothetical protein AOG54_04595 [Acidiplasma aeolicum]KQB35729.1 hypothetical protein AOG55_05965 [Acidiplasma cupricumulans]WMT54605.1 MAG: exosome complex RNA-binding protein Csl4 [Acidiplasma sp.]
MVDSDIALPGDIIAKEEEYLPGKNTEPYDGNIVATKLGRIVRDDKNLTISVVGSNKKTPIGVGSIVYGKVIKINGKDAIIQLYAINEGGKLHPVDHEAKLMLPVQGKSGYTHIISLGDIVRAKVTSVKPIYVTIFNTDLGVLKTRCLICRNELILKNNVLYCTNCQRIETRKIASDYGNINISGDNCERS